MKCLVPGCKRQPTRHHWPIKKTNGGDLTVPLCKLHHDQCHSGNKEISDNMMNFLIKHAPIYWREKRIWNQAEPVFHSWLAQKGYGEKWVIELYE